MAGARLAVVTVVALVGCGRAFYDPAAVPSDAGPIPPVATGSFSEPTPLPLSTTSTLIDDPTLTADLLEIYFEGDGVIFVATRPGPNDPFSAPVPVAGLDGPGPETNPEVSYDGLELFFSRDTRGSSDLFVTTRASREAPWPAPVLAVDLSGVGPTFNLARTYAVLHGAGVLYGQQRASTSDPWSTRFTLTGVSEGGGSNAFLSPDGLQLFYQRGTTELMIFRSTRESLDDPWPSGTPVTELDESGTQEGDPWLSPTLDHVVYWQEADGGFTFLQATR